MRCYDEAFARFTTTLIKSLMERQKMLTDDLLDELYLVLIGMRTYLRRPNSPLVTLLRVHRPASHQSTDSVTALGPELSHLS
jgi:hypothetical protein